MKPEPVRVGSTQLEAARLGLCADASGLGERIVRASGPVGRLTDGQGAVIDTLRVTASEDGFRRMVCGALPGVEPAMVGSLWATISDRPDLKPAHEILVLRALDPLGGLLTYPEDVLFTTCELAQLGALPATASTQAGLPAFGLTTVSITGIVKITRLCNLRCSYCHDWRTGKDAGMAFGVRARAMHWLLGETGAQQVHILLHGGEPALVGMDGLLTLLALQARYRRAGQRVITHMQTNGTRLTAAFIDFLARFDISVSVSLDGPPEVHDQTRRDVRGRPSSERVCETLGMLRAAGILNGVLVVVTPALIAAGARRLVGFLAEQEIRSIGLLAMRPGASQEATTATSLPVADYCRFMLEVEEARIEQAPWLEIRELDAARAALAGASPRTCELQGHCVGSYFAIEPDGAITHCDKFVGDSRYRLGSVDDSFAVVAGGGAASALRLNSIEGNRRKRACPWWRQCKGWCPHEDYVAHQADGRWPVCCGLAPLFSGLAERYGASLGPAHVA